MGNEASANPYQATADEATWTTPAPIGSRLSGELTVGNVLSHVWRMFRERPWDCLLFTLVFWGLYLVGVLGQQLLIFVADQGIGAVVALVALVSFAAQLVLGAFFTVAWANFAGNRIAGRPGLSELFRNIHRWPRIVGANLVVSLVMVLAIILFSIVGMVVSGIAMALFGAPNFGIVGGFIWVGVLAGALAVITRYIAAQWLIVHYDARVMESLTLSARYMRGKKLAAIWVFFVLGMLGGVIALLTVGLAMLVLPAVGGLIWGVVCELVIPARADTPLAGTH